MNIFKEKVKEFKNSSKKDKIKKICLLVFFLILPILVEIIVFDNKGLAINKGSILRVGFQYFIYVIIAVFYILELISDKLKRCLEWILKYRYIIALVAFILMVAFQLNTSNVGVWSQVISSDRNQDTTILGVEKSIRSDEWVVQTPFFLSQAMNKDDFYPLENQNVRPDEGQNMLMVYPAPVADISIIGKVQSLGFLLLGRDFGFSWYWAMKVILLVLMSMEIAIILTKRDPLLSIIGGLWIAFSPAIQWWMSSNSDIYMHGFAIMVIFYYYVNHADWKYWKKILLGIGMMSSIAGFVFCFYPPVQVPMAFLIFLFIVIEFIKNRKHLKKQDYWIMGITFLLTLGVLAYYVVVSKDAIELMMSTTYPGQRTEMGGNASVSYLINYVVSLFTPFISNSNGILGQINSNQCEISSSIYPFIGLLCFIIYSFKNIKQDIKNKDNWQLYGLVGLFILLLIYCFFGFGNILSKITFFSFCQAGRVFLVLGILGMMLCLLFVKKYNKKPFLTKMQSIIISILVIVVLNALIYSLGYQVVLTKAKLLVAYPIVFALTYTFLRANKKAFSYVVLICVVMAGLTINPLERGLGAIYHTDTAEEIQNVVEQDSGALWIGDTAMSAQYLLANGAKSLNGINYYPNFKVLHQLDPDNKYDEVYNRYAHITVRLSDAQEKFELLQPDSYIMNLTYEDLKSLGVRYCFVRNPMDEEQVTNNHLQEIYRNEKEGTYIYSVE